MTRKKKTILSVLLFVLIFGALLATATFTDLQVSNILAAPALADHTYLSDNTFGVTFESLGSDPIYLAFAFAFMILFWYCARKKSLSSAPKTILAAVFAVCAFIACYVLCSDTMEYIHEHLVNIEHSQLSAPAWLVVTQAISAAFICALGLFAVRNFSDEQIENLFSFAVATLVFVIVSTAVLHLIKGPVGRIRFRAMNMYPDSPDYGFAKFARWYEINGQWISKDQMMTLFGTTDALKSFPSGHTCAAGASYFLPMLNDALHIKNKGVRALLWICPVVITGIVAVSRIVVGAHFFSDVLVGGSFAFVCMIISREIFVLKCANLKALTGKEAD